MLKQSAATTLLLGATVLASPTFAQNAERPYCQAGYAVADTDGDGYISENELTAVRDAQFADLDADGDGAVTKEEFANCMTAWAPEEASDPADEQDLAEFDEDGDGSLSADEFMGGMQETAGMQIEPGSVQSTSATSDTASEGQNGDGQILLLRRLILVPSDYDDARMQEMSAEELAARSGYTFETTDADGNAAISVEEWKDRYNTVRAQQVLDREFDSLDADASGDVSRLEYYSAGLKKWEQAQLTAEDKGMEENETGAPVVYFYYPSPM